MSSAKQVCCRYDYDDNGVRRVGRSSCIPILPPGAPAEDGKISAAECVQNKTIVLPNGNPLSVPNGTVAECCVDCEERAATVKLVVQGGRLVRSGGALTTSPDKEPDKCCCGDTPCCKKVEGCGQVRCYQEPEECDRCAGRCVTYAYDEDGNEVIEDQDVNCATKTQCCLDDTSRCLQHCRVGEAGAAPKYTLPRAWAPMLCTTCGICCKNGRGLKEDDDGKPMTKKVCEETIGGTWYQQTDDENVCNPQCCVDVELGEAKSVVCHHTKKTECDSCVGKCTELKYSRPPEGQDVNNQCPISRCKTKQECCGEGGEKCMPVCGELDGAEFKWEEINCGTNSGSDGDKCGVCCKTTYNEEETEETGTECAEDIKTKEECEALRSPVKALTIGAWFPFETCAVCDGVNCCKEIKCDFGPYAVCAKVDKDNCENKCLGFCNELLDGFVLSARYCKTKQDCCGNDGALCKQPECAGDDPQLNEWLPGCADPETCGVCCIVTLKEDGTGVAKTRCNSDLTKIECSEQDDGDITITSWRAFETCDSVDCATKRCCGEICPDVIGCKTVDFEDECDECAGKCTDINTGDKNCATKQSCCGSDGKKCDPNSECYENTWSHTCHDSNTINTRCGVCCVLIADENGEITDSYCDPVTYKECQDLNNVDPWTTATWREYETCASVICRPKQCCKTNSCGKAGCTTIDYNDECPDECAGECTKIVDGEITCATKEDCCGANGEKCAPCPPAVVAQYSWNAACANEKKCGVCCGVTTDTNGKTIKVECKDLDQDQCANEADNVFANEFWTWKPWATCENAICATKKCCDKDCADKFACIDVDFNKDCDECAGLCTAYDAAGNPGEVTCKTKAACCGNNNYDCDECTKSDGTKIPKKAGWAGPCGSDEKCGVCCKVTTDGTKTTAAECIQKTKQECEALGQGPNVTHRWVANATCESAKCATKTCCDKNCAGEDACVEVDFNKECDPCKGLCMDIASGAKTCKTKQSCCGGDGKACEDQTDCGGGVATKSWSAACADANKCGVCCKIVLADDGEIKSADCQQIAKDACLALDNGDDIVASWRPFETCASVKCATKTCCGPRCPGSTVFTCIQIDFNQTCDPCSSVCTEIATGNTSCKTKQDCCGVDGENCGACEKVATHSWSGVCGDGSKCGVCCTLNYEDGELKSTSCAKGTNKSCTDAADAPDKVTSWHEFETCGSIKCATKKCCGEDCAKKVGCVDVDFNKECDPCKGICTDIGTGKKSCSSKVSCCGSDGGKCGGVCGQDQTHSWAPDCADGSKCGVCCVVEYEDGKVVSANCSNVTQENCTAQNAPPFFVATWHPFETCDTVKCATKTCCQDSQCVGVTCADIDYNDDCNYCHGICTDTTGAKFCETKQKCCGNDGKNCGAGKNSWSAQCGDGTQCGVCCQITYAKNGNIKSSKCLDSDYTECADAKAADPPNRQTSWRPFEVCPDCAGACTAASDCGVCGCFCCDGVCQAEPCGCIEGCDNTCGVVETTEPPAPPWTKRSGVLFGGGAPVAYAWKPGKQAKTTGCSVFWWNGYAQKSYTEPGGPPNFGSRCYNNSTCTGSCWRVKFRWRFLMCDGNALQDITDWVTAINDSDLPCACETTACETFTWDPCSFADEPTPPCPETVTSCSLVPGNPLQSGGWASRGCCLSGEYCWVPGFGFGGDRFVPLDQAEVDASGGAFYDYCRADTPDAGWIDDMPTLNCDAPPP